MGAYAMYYYIDPRDLMFLNMPKPGVCPSQGVILKSILLYMGVSGVWQRSFKKLRILKMFFKVR